MNRIAKGIASAAALSAMLLMLQAAPASAAKSKCSSAKFKEAGKKAAAKAGCHSKAVGKGDPVDGECLSKAEGKFTTGWTKAEAKGDCLSTGDEVAIEAKVDAFIADLNTALGGPGPSKCTSSKIKEAGKKVAAKTKCLSKAVAKDLPVDSACLQKAEGKFTSAYGKAEAKGDCIAGNGDAAAIEADIDAFLDDLGAELQPPPTTTTTSTSTTTTTIGAPVCGNGNQEAGESCDDGNTSDNDACPGNCIIAPCTPIGGSNRQVDVNFAPPIGVGVAGIRVLVNYPEGKVSIPGSGGSIPAGIITDLPAGASGNANDLDHALREVVASSNNMPTGRLFRVHFENCQGAPAPTAADFTCAVLDASDASGNDVIGVTCTVVP